MIQKPAAIQETRPVPVESDAAMRAARETVLDNSTWIAPLQAEMARVIVDKSTCSTGCWSPCSPTAMCSWKACRGWRKLWR